MDADEDVMAASGPMAPPGSGMVTDLDRIATLARGREEENWRFRAFLKGCDIPEGRIDRIVHRLYREVSVAVDCTVCANCCRVIAPTLDRDDVERLARGPGLTPDELVERYMAPDDEAGRYVFRDLPCPFLADGRCAHYGLRPEACRSFPHLHKDGFTTRLMGVVSNASVCPIVFNVLERLKAEVRDHEGYPWTREEQIIVFICGTYCQSCTDPRCNVEEVMWMYESNWLTPSQMAEVDRFRLDGVACANHVPMKGWPTAVHKIEVHYADGRVEEKSGWYTAEAISRLWREDVDHVEILFTEV